MSCTLTIQDIIEIESNTIESVWIVATTEGVGDLDNCELLTTVHANLKRGVTYQVILPEESESADEAPLSPGMEGSYQIRRLPRRIVDMLCPFQIHDAEKRVRRGFFSHVAGSDYFWVEMDGVILRSKMDSFKYLWSLPDEARAAFERAPIRAAAEDSREFDELIRERITEPDLRAIVLRDYRSSWTAFRAGLWKLSYVCCMGIIETVLDQLLQANGAFLDGADADRTSFAAKIVLARKQGLLADSDARLTHGLREIRNIVHPRAELRSGIVLTKHHVQMARSFLKVMLEQSSWARRGTTGL